MYCKICGQHLYREISFRNLFKIKYDIHIECESLLSVEAKESYVPIENQVIKYVWIYDWKKTEINYDFIEPYVLGNTLSLQLDNKDWSVCYIYREEEYDRLPDLDKYLLVKLCDEALLFLSLFRTQYSEM